MKKEKLEKIIEELVKITKNDKVEWKCVLCGKPTSLFLLARPLIPSDLENDGKLIAHLIRQSRPAIPICDGHSDEELKEKLHLS